MAKKDDSPAPPAGKPDAQQGLPLDDDLPLDKVPDPDWYVGDAEEGEKEPAPRDEGPLTSADFHNIAQKQILNAVFAVLSDAKMGWELVEPFMAAARDVLLGGELNAILEIDAGRRKPA